jgi:endonuclease I
MQPAALRVLMAGALLLGVALLARVGLVEPKGASQWGAYVPGDRTTLALQSAPVRVELARATAAGGSDPDVAAVHAWLHRQVRGHRVLSTSKALRALEELEADPADGEKLILFYSRRSVPRGTGERDGAQGWLREHLWPTSRGFADRNDPGSTDLHNLRVESKATKVLRGTRDFAAVGVVASKLDQEGFEPPDEVKGDVARALFYMDVRYDGEEGADLVLVDRWTRDGEPALGRLCTLLAWHEQDPVDDAERRRNGRVAAIQGNRNPFVDHPEFARILWGRQCSGVEQTVLLGTPDRR